MTDTTDIKALIERLRALAKTATSGRWWIDSHGETLVAFTDEGIETVLKPEHLREKAHRDENTGGLSYWPNDSDASWIAAAQPQNIIVLLDQLEAERQRAERGEAAAAIIQQMYNELKGGQVPVAITDDMAIAFHAATTDSALGRDDMEEIKAGLQAVQELFTATQKPIAVPRLEGCLKQWQRERDCEWVAAIEAAGGTVKDGE